MQESEQENNRAWKFHRKNVGAKAGTRKTCGELCLKAAKLTKDGIQSIS